MGNNSSMKREYKDSESVSKAWGTEQGRKGGGGCTGVAFLCASDFVFFPLRHSSSPSIEKMKKLFQNKHES